MKDVIYQAVKLMEAAQPFVLATVIKTSGSCPQRPGAKILIQTSPTMTGTVGGGCVEGDVYLYAQKMLANRQSQPQIQEYQLNEDIAMHDGLVCGGTMQLWIEPIFTPHPFLPLAQQIQSAYEGGPSVVMATVIKNANPELPAGTRFLVREDRTLVGSLGSDAATEQVKKELLALTKDGETDYITLPDGTELFAENFSTPPLLVVLGGGHVGKAVSRLAATLDFQIYLLDDRSEFANSQRFPEAAATYAGDFMENLARIPVRPSSFIVVATRGHKYDDVALEAALRTQARYVGLLGSRRKGIMICKGLLARGIPPERVKEVSTPIGLNIGAVTPEEIGVSIVAELIMVRRGGNGLSLKVEKFL